MTDFATSADGTRIAYESTGTGPALVLVDGALCYREFGPARDVAAQLSNAFTVYIYDRRGRGESGDTAPFAPEREYEDLAAVIAAAGGTAYVLGQSSGGALALQAAASGAPITKVAAYESPWVGLRPAKDGTPRDYHAELDALLSQGKRGAAVGYFMVKMVGAPAFVPYMMRLMPKVWKQLQSVAHTLPYDAGVMGARFTPPTAALATIGQPALIMAGSKAKAEMLDAQNAVAAAIPGSRHEVLDGQTHQVSPQVLADAVRDFFR